MLGLALTLSSRSLYVPSMVGSAEDVESEKTSPPFPSKFVTSVPFSQIKSNPPTRRGFDFFFEKWPSRSITVSMSSNSPNFKSWSVCVSLLMLGLALTSISHAFRSASSITSYPYISKQCLSFIITFCTLFKLLIIICWMPWKQWFTASGPCLVVIKRFNSPRDHFKSVVSLSYALSFF